MTFLQNKVCTAQPHAEPNPGLSDGSHRPVDRGHSTWPRPLDRSEFSILYVGELLLPQSARTAPQAHLLSKRGGGVGTGGRYMGVLWLLRQTHGFCTQKNMTIHCVRTVQDLSNACRLMWQQLSAYCRYCRYSRVLQIQQLYMHWLLLSEHLMVCTSCVVTGVGGNYFFD